MNNLIKKGVVISVILLFVSISVIPSTGNTVIEKHVSTENFPSDDSVIMKSGLSLITIKVEGEIGENEWYVSDVTFTITYESDEIDAVFYRIDGGEWIENIEPFVVSDDGQHVLEWYSVDYGGNQSEVDDPFSFKIDKTAPTIELLWDSPDNIHVDFTAVCGDVTSGTNRCEFFIWSFHQFTDYTEPYEWTVKWYPRLRFAVFFAYVYDDAGNSNFDLIESGEIAGCLRSLISSVYSDKDVSSQSSLSIVSTVEIVGKEKHVSRENTQSDCSISEDFEPYYILIVVDREMGENDWVVNDVNITFIPDIDGVAAVYYSIDAGGWMLYNELIVISQDGAHNFSWYVVDWEGNTSLTESIFFKIDQTEPWVDLTWTSDKVDGIWYVIFTAYCGDATSGVERVEFYKNGLLMYTDYEEPYEWNYPPIHTRSYVIGLIFNPQLIEENVTFFAFIVRVYELLLDDIEDSSFYPIAYDFAGNSAEDHTTGITYIMYKKYRFQQLIFPNNYTGRIGLFFIKAEFEEGPL